MKITRPLALIAAILILVSCERPSSPDFEIQQAFDIPLLKSVSYKLFGDDSGAIIDTTSEDFKDLFIVGEDGLVTLSSEIDFELGSFDDIIPAIDVDPTEVESEIGLLEIDDFSSVFESEIGLVESEGEDLEEETAEIGIFEVEFSGEGEADFTQVTGISPVPPVGTLIPESEDPDTGTPGSVDIFIELRVDEFEEALIKEGGIRFQFENDLGFDVSSISAVLLSEYIDEVNPGQEVGSQLNIPQGLPHGDDAEDVIEFDPDDPGVTRLLKTELAMKVTLQWSDQNLQPATDYELKVNVSDENLKVSRATAKVRGQALDPETEDLIVDNPEFVYALVSDDPEEGDFKLNISITNNTSLPVTNGTQDGLPSITLENSDGEILGDAVNLFEVEGDPGAMSIREGETGVAVIDLTGARITREMSYQLDIGTSGSGDNAVTIVETDNFQILSSTTALKFVEAETDVDPQEDIELEDTKKVEGDFVEAEVETGELVLVFNNGSAIDMVIEEMVFFNTEAFVAKNTGRFFEKGSEIGTISDVTVPAGGSATEIVPLDGVGISNEISYEGIASSPGSHGVAVEIRSEDLIGTDLDGSVQLKSATAVLEAQDFSTFGEVEISEDDFRLVTSDHYVEIASGVLRIRDIVNEIDLDIDTLIISFPDIRTDRDGTGAYDPADSLFFEFIGPNRIRRGSDFGNQQPEIEQALDNVRIYAPGNKVIYNVVAVTENTREAAGADTVRTVRSTDRFLASVEIEDLSIKTAFGDVQTRVELLNEDIGDDGIVDLFDDDEAEITEFDDFDEISDRISGIHLTNPSFDLIYDTNLGVKGTIVAAIVGINKRGEEVYLTGKPGSDLEVKATHDFENLYARGSQIDRSNMIKFEIEPVPVERKGSITTGVISFDKETSNVADFLSNLPVEIRFIGKVLVNPDGGESFVVDPIEFNTSMGIDIPINLSTAEGQPASIEDTLEVDLSDLPSPEDDLQLTEMVLYITYENGLPFSTGFEMQFLDDNRNPITTAIGEPLEKVRFNLKAAQVDQISRFVSQPSSDVTEIRITGEQLEHLYKTRNILLFGELATSRDELSGEVKVRVDDYIKMGINASFKTNVRVN